MTPISTIDRVEIGDLNGDKHPDIVISESRWPGKEPDANLFWFEHPSEVGQDGWKRHWLVTQYSMNSLKVIDLDQDNDQDILTAEHKGPKLELQLWKNDGQGHFSKITLDRGKENHLGTHCADLDNDGDWDIIGVGWDHYQSVYCWRSLQNQDDQK
ncbi:MAG: VCBS repeat-containing protein [Bacteroidia bacterium]|nr:VCBS repeat-containing protein [Bacteroidia bacterium]